MATTREIAIDEERVARAERLATARNMSLPDYLERLIRVATGTASHE
jgi:hypothetical protein